MRRVDVRGRDEENGKKKTLASNCELML